MAEAIILPVAKSILRKLASFTGDHVLNYVVDEIKAAKSVKKDLKLIAEDLSAICAVLQDADTKKYANQAINVWLRDLKSVVYDIDNLLDAVAFDSLQRSLNKGKFVLQLRYYLSGSNPIISRFEMRSKIKGLREELDHIVAKKNKFGLTERPVEAPSVVERDLFNDCAYVNKATVVGRDEAKNQVLYRLLSRSEQASSCPCVYPIVGIGGIGKTTLAKLVYNDSNGYFDVNLWVCVSDKFDVRKLLEDIMRDAGYDTTSSQTRGQLVKRVQDLLQGKKYFLVLDDVWVDDIATWMDLKSIFEIGKVGSVILITTRSAQVASITQTMVPYDLDRLPDDVCWYIFKQLAFREGEEHEFPGLMVIGRSIVEKCGGVPLVVKSLGSLLRRIRDEREWHRINNMDSLTKLPGEPKKVLELLRISYDNLPSYLKPCFAFCSLIFKDTELYPTQLAYMWNALGVLQLQDLKDDSTERSGYAYAEQLVSRSLLQEPQFLFDGSLYACRMHDLLHDLAVDVLGEELALVTMDKLDLSESSRHIVWGYEGPNGLLDQDFPTELLKAKKAVSFRFGNRMNAVSQSFLEGIISNFKCLRILEISDSRFKELPKSIGNLKHLRGLKLSYNPLLESLPDTVCELLNLRTLDLYGCVQLKELPKKIYKLTRLRYFVVTACHRTLSSNFNRLQSLHFLWLFSSNGLVSLWDDGNIGRLNSIRRLYIQNCPALSSLPNSMKLLVALEVLVLNNCQELDLEKGEGLYGLQSLQSLTIVGVPRLTSLPDGIESAATSLQYLCIGNCSSLTRLQDWLHHFTSLRKVGISNCPNLVALPEGFRNCNSLELIIRNCPRLPQT